VSEILIFEYLESAKIGKIIFFEKSLIFEFSIFIVNESPRKNGDESNHI